MAFDIPKHLCIRSSALYQPKVSCMSGHLRMRVFAASSIAEDEPVYIPAAPILLPKGPWQQISGGVTAAKGFKAAGTYGGLRAVGEKPDLALITCDTDAISAGTFTTIKVAAAPIMYCKKVLDDSLTARAVLINAGQANAFTGDAGYEDVLDCSHAVAELLHLNPYQVLIESTGVIGQRIKKEALLKALPNLVDRLSSSVQGADSAAVAITTTDLVSKSVAIESEIGGSCVKVGGMAKGSGMIHPNMATMLGVITTDALVTSDVWREMVLVAVKRSFNRVTVDGETSTNDCVIALASGLSGGNKISSLQSPEAHILQDCLHAVMQGLAKSIAWDGEGATCLIEVKVNGANSEAEADMVAIYGRDPNWGRIACAVSHAGVPFDQNKLQISLGNIMLMNDGQPLQFDRAAASNYLRAMGEIHGTVVIQISIGDGAGSGLAWGCDLSYDYVKINAEYTTAAASNYLRAMGEIHGTVVIQISIGDGAGSGLAWGCDLSYDYVKINAEYTT
ncbi:arginine biosynthesis bifunctional protein ArgJ, chloroplastic [Dorcoceras hygrometricum]|uniref:Arginine biosynthesis bifunctional protein ArgJ, chloroplastic n=1 Tax=Dorcoceras hygrometricum TaxID=472368 RepID=A0A2Z7D465_9LAMI|nr:arginine biosynthesis bifunctional protein ArgJ, chloroplastic [Dorcoceras hygrometricum]